IKNGMLIFMSLGMLARILMVTILVVNFHGYLFKSTIYAIIIGFVVGFLAGLPIGLSAVIDGILSGLMGGMMGAMLGDMVAMTRPNAIINIIAVLITMVLLLVLYAAEESIRKQASQQILSFFKYPFLMIFTIAILF